MPYSTKNEVLTTRLFDELPVSAIWLKPVFSAENSKESVITDFEVRYYNKTAASLLDIGKHDILRRALVKDKLLGGMPGEFEQSLQVFINDNSDEYSYFDSRLQKHFKVVTTRVNNGLLKTALDVTEQVTADKKVREQAAFLNEILDASINAVFLCEAIRDAKGNIVDLLMLKINNAFTQIIVKTAAEVEGKTYLSLFPSAKATGIFDLNCQVIETGEPYRKEIYYKGENIEDWYDISLARPAENRLLVTFNTITKEKQAGLRVQHQKTLLDNILKYSPSGISVIKILRDENGKAYDGSAIMANDAAMQIIGIQKGSISNKISLIDAKIVSNPLFQSALLIVETGRPILTQYYLKSSGRWLELGISKMDDDHLIIVFTDVTASKEVQLGVERSAKQLLGFINTAHSGMSHMLPVKNAAGEVIDFTFGVTNNVFAGYAGEKPETVTGHLVSRFYPTYKKNGLFDRYRHTYITSETSRFETHYVGDNVDAWFDIMSTKIEDGVLVTLADTTVLKKLQIDLEDLVNELKKSNENLQEFAYVASHDLQEPLRKIQVFSERLQKDMKEALTEDNKKIFDRMVSATQRMSQLINDLLSYSQLSTKALAFKTVNVKEVVHNVLTDLEAGIVEKKATVSVGELPELEGDPIQLRQLFQNLLSNSLKYSREGIPAVISIKAKVVQKEISGRSGLWNEIAIADNGIGFEQHEADRIFKVFQRLHGRSEYPGTGIGLAIVQKVVENHNGRIFASGEPDKGATFTVDLPIQE